MDAEQTSQVLQRLQLLEQAATEQLIARRNAEHSLVEAQTSVGAIDQELTTDMTNPESSTDALSNEAMTCQKKARSVQLYLVLIMSCTGRSLDRIANAPRGWSMEAWLLFQAFSPKNNARLVVMMIEVLAFPLDADNVVNSLETMERKVKEFERCATIEIPEFLKIGIVIRQAEEGPMRTHLIMNSHRLATFQDIKKPTVQ